MTVATSMQFFLREGRDEHTVLKHLGVALGFLVESSDVRVEGSVGFLQMDNYANGFQQGYLVSWPSSVKWDGDERAVARLLATHLNTDVLLELGGDADLWLVAHPDGGQEQVSVSVLDDGIDVSHPDP